MAKKSAVSSLFLLLIFVLVISEMATAALPKICERGSKMYSGNCYSKLCDKKCKEWEKAQHGACHKREGKNTCYCYYDCDKSPPGGSPAPPADAPPPPAEGGSPPPADGGSPPPPTTH